MPPVPVIALQAVGGGWRDGLDIVKKEMAGPSAHLTTTVTVDIS